MTRLLSLRWLLVAVAVLSNIFYVSAQIRHISGIISDEAGGEVLPSATVLLLENGSGATANLYGHYQITANAAKSITLIFSYVGYRPDTLQLPAGGTDTTIHVALSAWELATVEVSAARERAAIGVASIPVSRLRAVPVLLGEADLFKALTLLPGISSGVEGTTGLLVRGGSADQNLVLLDGSVVYNTSHLFGFVSVFQPSAIKDIQVIKGGFPARYGGRLSSVVNVTMKDGNTKAHRREASLGLINSSLTLEGPLGKNSSYLLAGRMAHSALLSLATLPAYHNGDYLIFAGMYDFNGKLNFQLPNGGRLFISAYAGDDMWGTKEKQTDNRGTVLLGWGNKTASIRYIQNYSPALFGQTMLNFNDFTYWANIQSKHSTDGLFTMRVASRIRELTARQWFSWTVSQQHYLHFGLEASRPVFRPNATEVSRDKIPVDDFTSPGDTVRALSGAVFLEDEWTPAAGWKIHAGLRAAVYRTAGQNYPSLEPRLSVEYQLSGNQRIQLGYSRMTQFVHLITSGGAGLPNDIWLPATERIPPQRSDQIHAGWAKDFKGFSLTVEAFAKQLYQQTELTQGASFVLNGNTDWQGLVESGGRGRVYGLEWLINKQEGRWNGWLAYTLSWNTRQFANINRGEPFPFRYDRRHDLSITGTYQVNARLKLSSNFIFQTGNAFTLLSSVQEDLWGDFHHVYSDKNNQRMPAYHRLDLNAHYEYLTRKKRTATLIFGAYNIYGHPNAFFVESQGTPPRFERVTLFRFIPAFSYTVKW